MKNLVTKIALLFLLVNITNLALFSKEKVKVNDVVEMIENTLISINSEIKDLKLEEVSVSLKGVNSTEKGAGFSVYLSGETTKNSEYESNIKFTFYNKEFKNKKLDKKSKEFTDNSILKNAIISASNEFKSLKNIGKLKDKKLSVTIAFTVIQKIKGGLKIELFGIGFDGSVSKNQKIVQTIDLKFVQK